MQSDSPVVFINGPRQSGKLSKEVMITEKYKKRASGKPNAGTERFM